MLIIGLNYIEISQINIQITHMIKYLLRCKDCSQEFESWFGTSDEYDRLLKLKLLNCQACESINVEKSLMSPNLLNTRKKENLQEIKKYKEVRKKLSDYKKFVKDNGVILYCNCSLFFSEGEKQIIEFVEKNRDWRFEKISNNVGINR